MSAKQSSLQCNTITFGRRCVITTPGHFNMIADKVEFIFFSLAGVPMRRRISPVSR